MAESLEQYLAVRVVLVDEALGRFLPGLGGIRQSLHKAMHYSVFAGGKRLRPVLMIAAAEAVGGDAQQVMHAACAMEMLHTYSLIHDDLPAMDDDDFRRGRPTNHKVFGEAHAILAGDALLTEAFRLLADSKANADVAPEVSLRIIEIMGRYAGSQGMVGGQVVDMESEGQEIDLPTLEYIHTHKTGALILASIQIGALLAGAEKAQFEALTRFGEAAGLAFQVADDILDVVGESDELGKNAGSDQARGKATYPALLGLAQSKERATALCAQAVNALDGFGAEADPLRDIAQYIVQRNS